MDVFQDYADFYDELYEDKDYLQECEFIKGVLEKYGEIPVNTLLDVGCGTGSHALHFAEMGYLVTGVDLSEDMLAIARKKAERNNKHIRFIRQDLRNLHLDQKFDAAVAMFAVMGYQTTNTDFEAALKAVHSHLEEFGLFIFDVWFGPAVLKQKPADRLKKIERNNYSLIRYAHPVIDINQQTVEVNYHMLYISNNLIIREIRESHLMRFFFSQELAILLEKNGYKLISIHPFMNPDDEVGEDCWNITITARKVCDFE